MKYLIFACFYLSFSGCAVAQKPHSNPKPIRIEPMIIAKPPSAAMSLPSASAQATSMAAKFTKLQNWTAADSVLSRALTQIDDNTEQFTLWLERVKIAKMAVESSLSPKSAEKGRNIAHSLEVFLRETKFSNATKSIDNLALANKHIIFLHKVDVDFLKVQKELNAKPTLTTATRANPFSN
jgi:hypothetical protein